MAGTLQKLSDPLKGIGPATASLILAVHDPEHVIFFSDEAYRWLCANGEKTSPKYNVKEFDDLHANANALMARLKVTPIEVEKVAFVIIKEKEPVKEPKPKPVPSGRPRGRPPLPESEKKPKKPTVPGRGRGRPPGTTKVAPKSPTGTGKRGRPAAAKTEEAEVTPTKSESKRERPAAAKIEEVEATPAKSENKRKAADDTPGTGRSKRSKA